jgi:hypothetical protein
MFQALLPWVIDWGGMLGRFIAPIIQLLFIVMILIAAAERFGFTQENREWAGFSALGATNNVQAFIAVSVVGALVLGALAGVDISALKDIALVVVGFYFGTRHREGEIEAAVAAGVDVATAAQKSSQPATSGGQT